MDKPRPGKTTFVIMVSPLPGKYELPACRPTATSDALHCTHTLTFRHAPPTLLGPSTQRIHALSSRNSSVLSHATGDHIVFQHQMTDQQPLRSDIYIRHASSVASREALRPTPRPSPRLPPPTPSRRANRPAGALWGKRRPPPAPVLPPATCWDPARSAACLNFCPAQLRSGGRLKPVHLFSNNGVQRGEQNI